MLIDRGGIVTHVIVGDHQKLFCPIWDGARRSWPSAWSASGSHPSARRAAEPRRPAGSWPSCGSIWWRRLALAAADGQSACSSPIFAPNEQGELWRELPPVPLQRQEVVVDELIPALEDEYQKAAQAAAMVDDGRDRAVVVHVVCTGDPTSGAEAKSTIQSRRGAARAVRDRRTASARCDHPEAGPARSADAAWQRQARRSGAARAAIRRDGADFRPEPSRRRPGR